MPGPNSIPVFNPGGGNNPSPPSSGGGGGSSGGGSGSAGGSPGGSSGGGSGGGGGGGYGSQAWYNRQQSKAANKYLEQAKTIQEQIDALRKALGPKGFERALRQKLSNVRLSMRQSDAELRQGYHDRVGSLQQTAEDNEKAGAGQGYANLQNRARERANSVAEAAQQGAGETDILAAQQISLRNWQSNQNEVQRSFFDTKSSIEASLTDLTTDTRSARISNVQQANADKEQLWTGYYDQRSETLTALGNALGQQAEYYGLAQEAKGSKKAKAGQKRAAKQSGRAFTQASLTAGQAWDSPGVRAGLRNWEGADLDMERPNSRLTAAVPNELSQARPEGATLRKW